MWPRDTQTIGSVNGMALINIDQLHELYIWIMKLSLYAQDPWRAAKIKLTRANTVVPAQLNISGITNIIDNVAVSLFVISILFPVVWMVILGARRMWVL